MSAAKTERLGAHKPKRHWIGLGAAFGLAHAALSLSAANPELSVQERLQQLESAVESLKKENEQLRQQAGLPAKGLGALVRANGKEDKLAIGGLIQAQGEFGNAPDSRFPGTDRFLARRMRLNVQGSFAEHFEFKLEGEFGNGSTAANAGYRAQMTDGFVAWTRYDAAKLKLGQFKTPFGFEQLASDPRLYTAERSLPNDRLTLGRQIGLGMSGDFLENRLNYSAGVFNGSGVNNGFNDNENFTVAGRVAGMPLKTKWKGQAVEWSMGANAYQTDDASSTVPGFGLDFTPATAARDNIFHGERHAWGVDTQLAFGRFGAMAEYLRAYFDPSNNLPADRFEADGWYVLSYYDIVRNKLQAVVRFETFDPNTDAPGTTSDVWTIGLNYFIKGHDLKFELNYLLGDPADQSNDDQGRVIARMQVVF